MLRGMRPTLPRALPTTALLALLAAGCGDPPGEDAGLTRDAGPELDAGPGVDAGPADAGGGADAGPGGLVDLPPPDVPAPPTDIGVLTVELRTADSTSAGTDDGLELCLSATRCFRLDTPEVNDFRRGEIDVFQIEGVSMPRAEVDRVELRTVSAPGTDNDRFTAGCLALRFDGEPVYCEDAIPGHIGTGTSAGEAPSFTDPVGLHEACVTCESHGTLTHGPVLGAPAARGLRVWVRTDATRPVALLLSESADGAGAAHVAWALPRPETDYATELTVEDLPALTDLYYDIEVDGVARGEWRPIASAPPPDAGARIGIGSCSQEAAQPTFDALRAEELDLFLFVGDSHYGNASARAAHRFQYRRARSIDARAAFLASTPVLTTWDDHDFVGNNSDGGCRGRETALEGFSEYWPNPSFGTPGAPGAYTRHRQGMVEVFLADCRYYRPRVDDPGRRCDEGPALIDDGAGPLGEAQMTWLLDGLASSDATFKIVGCGSLFTSTAGLDSWASFPAARDRLFDELARRGVSGVVLASGDIHRSELRYYPRDGAYDLVELVSSPLAQYPRDANPGRTACDRSDAPFCYPWDSYITVEAVPAADPRLVVEVHDETGAVIETRTILRSSLE